MFNLAWRKTEEKKELVAVAFEIPAATGGTWSARLGLSSHVLFSFSSPFFFFCFEFGFFSWTEKGCVHMFVGHGQMAENVALHSFALVVYVVSGVASVSGRLKR